MTDTKKCQGCYEVTHPKSQYACDKCMALMQLQDAINVAQTALNDVKEKWTMFNAENK